MMMPMSLKAGLLLLSQLCLTRAMVLTPRQTPCSIRQAAIAGETCDKFASRLSLNVEMFKSINPGIDCDHLVEGQGYCVIAGAEVIETTTTLRTPSLSTSTEIRTTSSLASDQPHETGTAANCNNWYKVPKGEECDTIENRFGIDGSKFLGWNTAVYSNCTNLREDHWYCVSVPEADKASIITSATATPTQGVSNSTNVITTPQPIQTDMVANCDGFYLVKPGDICDTIAKQYNITLDFFYSWNPAVGTSCATLEKDFNVCIHTIGSTPPKSTPTLTSLT